MGERLQRYSENEGEREIHRDTEGVCQREIHKEIHSYRIILRGRESETFPLNEFMKRSLACGQAPLKPGN